MDSNLQQDTENFNHFFGEFCNEQLSPEQRAVLWQNSDAMATFKKSLLTVFNHAKSSLAITPQSDAPIGIIGACKEGAPQETNWVAKATTMFGYDRLHNVYPETGERNAVVIEFPGTINLSGIWATLAKRKVQELLTQTPTPQQIDLIIPYLRLRSLAHDCSYIIPIKGHNRAKGDTIVFVGITAHKLEGREEASDRNIIWSIYGDLDLMTMQLDILPADNNARENYAVVLVH